MMKWPKWFWSERFGVRPREQTTIATIAVLLAVTWFVGWRHRGGGDGQLVSWDELNSATNRQPVLFLVDINQAEWPELAALPRIGETLAKRIVSSRATDGRFQSVEQLRRVRGIGPKTIDLIRRYATVRGDIVTTEATRPNPPDWED